MSDIREQINDKIKDLQAYRGTEVYAHFVSLLLLIDKTYDDDLRSVSPENLRYKQGAAKQVSLLADTLIASEYHGDIPKV